MSEVKPRKMEFAEVIAFRQLHPEIAYNTCVSCGSTGPHELRGYNMMWHDGDIYCKVCGSYVRMFDAG